MEPSIYVCHHKASRLLKNDPFTPIHVGKILSFNDVGCRGDDSGENISSRNPFYCELTGHYWIWKNDRSSDFIGLMHYRRYLNLSGNQGFPEDQWGCINENQSIDNLTDKYALSKDELLEFIGASDAVLPKTWDVRLAGSKNNYDHYKKSPDLRIGDYDLALKIMLQKYPEYSAACAKYNESPFGYYNNMFIMKREVFDKYSAWLFNILFELERLIDMGQRDQQQKRVFGHISERLLGIYFTHQASLNTIRVKEAQRIFCNEGSFNGKIRPAFSDHNIPTVICFDNNYVHSGAALLNSIITHSNANHNYDILILEDRVSEKNKTLLHNMLSGLSNFSLRFFDINTFSEIKGAHTRAHFSPATYARLFIPALFEQQEKVVFIDADTVVQHDIAELLEIDLGEHLVAAAKDIVMEGFVYTNTPSDETTGALPAGRYLTEYLGLNNPSSYFQAGLMVFNLSLMRHELIFDSLMKKMRLKPYWFLDQDIMNYVFQERVHYLPLKWNVFHGNNDVDSFFSKIPFSTYIDYLDARRDPYMVHFAGTNKPWIDPSVDFSNLYWAALRNTPWYEQCQSLAQKKFRNIKGNIKLLGKEVIFRNAVKKALGGLLPPGTKRRRTVAMAYIKLISFFKNI